ncbi:flagellar assembly protein FliW [Nocardioides sp. SOB77]|uniref:Flagellar assembly factor FliW n=1 Tax=Nocardioides oceani TaxID=3058369 RepID=A0ABT8FFX8_9ACTN|nr:flagellar assembly protein FliW [Nocardioides oceani]MDN4173578.1 flagellar assembly protein FliW [Nocardioides oceani]
MSDIPVIEMVHPLPGFPGERRFTLVELDEDGVLCALRSLEDPDLRFLVAPPAPFFPDYAPVVDDATVADLAITSAEEVVVLLVLTPGGSLQETTANLRAPLVLNTSTRRACQVILDDAALSVTTPLVA